MTSELLKKLLALNETPWRWAVGIEAALAIALPAATFTVAGYPSEGLIASLGAFTVLHFTSAPRRTRALALPFVAAGLVAASALGIASAGSMALTITGLVVTAGVASALMQFFAAGPPGALMFVIVEGVSGHLANRVADSAFVPLWIGMTAAASYLIIVGRSWLLPGRSRAAVSTGGQRRPWRLGVIEAAIATRLMVAAGAAAMVTEAFGVDRVYWSVAASVAVLQANRDRTMVLLRATHRVIGSLAGIAVFGSLLSLRPSGLGLVMLLALLQGLGEIVVVRNYGFALAFITPVALLIANSGNAIRPWTIIEDRLADTVVGAVVAVTVFLAFSSLTSKRLDRR